MNGEASGGKYYPRGRARGLAEARRRIAEAGRTNAEELDIGHLNLAQMPTELFELEHLKVLDLRWNDVGDEGAKALSPLVNLTLLDLEGNDIGDDGAKALSPLVNLTSLNLGNFLSNNNIRADGAKALSSLVNLTMLNLEDNNIGADGAKALSPLVNLTQLDLKWNNIGDDGARALAGLTQLTSLDLIDNNIGDDGAKALSGLTQLTSLDLTNNNIGDDGARALSSLTQLTSLDLRGNNVSDLSPLLALTKLRKLSCSNCKLSDAIPELWNMPSLKEVILYEATLPGVPAEVLSRKRGDNCLHRLRAHFADLGEDASELTDVKLMFLGNGRVGKTQIARRLRGKDYDAREPSTHGVRVSSAPLPVPPADTATLKIWDFGGQDIYHSTHALFLKTRAVFLLAWEPGSENIHEHEYGGFTFRNQPLGYWLAYVRHFAGQDAPVLVVQAQCDRPEQEVLRAPVPDETLDAFPFKKVLHYSAKEDRGRPALDDALAEAVRWLRERQGMVLIGKGRAAVKAQLEEMYEEGEKLISQQRFRALCDEVGNISSPPALLDYLHNIGTVFYRKGLFGDAIILDQAWALEAVYAVFDRDSKAFKNIERAGGRFRRSELAEWVWSQHGRQEQELFISFMRQCDICFTHREGDARVEAEYIAPDLLPARGDPVIVAQLHDKWGMGAGDAEAMLTYDLLPPGLMRSLIAKVGTKAGLAAEYWRDGFYFYDADTSSRALVQQHWTGGWAGEIRVEAKGGQAEALRDRLLRFIDERRDALGAHSSGRHIAACTPEDRTDDGRGRAELRPAHEPTPDPEYYVSYSWNDATNEAREAGVDRLCGEAETRGIKIIRDKTDMRNGDRISKFMDRIGRGAVHGRVFIFLSDKYLHSPFCMRELFDVWRNCREDPDTFIARTRVFVLPCAKISDEIERADYVIHWQDKFAKIDVLVKARGLVVLGDKGVADYRWMSRFVHETANMLELVQDVLSPRDIEAFLEYGFDDLPGA